MHAIIFSPSAEKELKRIPVRDRNRIVRAIAGLAKDPHAGKKLKGKLEGAYSLRVWPYRVVYCLEKKQLIVFIVRIGHRAKVY